MTLLMILIIWIVCDECKWHCPEPRDGFHPIDNSRDFVETSVDYYPVAQSRHLDVHISVFGKGTFHSERENTNQSVTGNQRTTVIALKQKVRAVTFCPLDTSQGIEDQSRLRSLTVAKKSDENQTTSVSVNVWEFLETDHASRQSTNTSCCAYRIKIPDDGDSLRNM
jgi:hypothetical protein